MVVVSQHEASHFEGSFYNFFLMDFSYLSDGIHTDFDFSDPDDDNSISGQHQREENINLQDGIIEHSLPQKNDWTFESHAK